MLETKTKLSLNLDVAKRKLYRVKNLIGSHVLVKAEPESFSLYDEDVDDPTIDSAVNFFSLPTPDIMKTFSGPNLACKTPAANTPTLEGRSFAEETTLHLSASQSTLNTPQLKLETPSTVDLDNLFQRTPQLPLDGSLTTPVVDPNHSRHPLAGVLGIAPPVSLSQEGFASTTTPVTTSVATPINQHRESPLATHTITAYGYDDANELNSSTGSFVEPHSQPPPHYDYSLTSYHELKPREVDHLHLQHTVSEVPTVVQDHIYSTSPALSPNSVASDTSSQYDSRYSYSTNNNKRKSPQTDSHTTTKKPRMTKKQQFVELQQREQWLLHENEELRRRVDGMTEGCRKLKAMLMERMTAM